jgi:hypothetical protein
MSRHDAAEAVIEVDVAGTERRIRALRRYVNSRLLSADDTFICPHRDACRGSIATSDVFREGTMSHVGHRFDLQRDGRPLRVVVVGQESGWGEGSADWHPVDLDARYRTVHDVTGLQRSYYMTGGRKGRNPHMRGTTSALRIIFGKGLGVGHDEEFVHPVNAADSFHLYDGFALVNRLLCSASPPSSSKGTSSPTMRHHCEDHFAQTLKILEPTLVVVQGRSVETWTKDLLVPTRRHGDHVYEADRDGQRAVVCVFSHPAAHGPQRWGDSLSAPYLTQIVVPTLTKALGLL